MTREEAVTEIKERVLVTEYVDSSYVDCVDIEALRIAIKALEQPERKRGKWILVEESIKVAAYKCSECGRNVWNDMGYDVVKDYPFCHCGADMRGEQE